MRENFGAKNIKISYKDGLIFIQPNPVGFNCVEDDIVQNAQIEFHDGTVTITGLHRRWKRFDDYYFFNLSTPKGQEKWDRFLHLGPYSVKYKDISITYFSRFGLWLRKLRGLPVPVRPELKKQYQNVKRITFEMGFRELRFKPDFKMVAPEAKVVLLEAPYERIKR